MDTQRYDEAEKTILPVVEDGKPKTIIPLAMSVLGAIRENAGKYKEAITTYNSFWITTLNTISHPKYMNHSRGFMNLPGLRKTPGPPMKNLLLYILRPHGHREHSQGYQQ